jgi:hypothetical protein
MGKTASVQNPGRAIVISATFCAVFWTCAALGLLYLLR